jgi:hypothetical protein
LHPYTIKEIEEGESTRSKERKTNKIKPSSSPQTAPAVAGGVREYYLTTDTNNGANASTACITGYHMASMWEILDPSSLKYNTALGHTKGDSGSGPPVERGWVRTGSDADNSDVVGRANCMAWTTTTGYGTTAILPNRWEADWEDLLAWNVYTWQCDSTSAHVWCVADRAGFSVFLPLIMRSFP